jgi:hypothetical protein
MTSLSVYYTPAIDQAKLCLHFRVSRSLSLFSWALRISAMRLDHFVYFPSITCRRITTEASGYFGYHGVKNTVADLVHNEIYAASLQEFRPD